MCKVHTLTIRSVLCAEGEVVFHQPNEIVN